MMESPPPQADLVNYLPPGLADKVLPYLPQWMTAKTLVLAAIGLCVASLAYNLILIYQKSRLSFKLAAKEGLVRKMQLDLRERQDRLDADETKIEEQNELIEEQRQLLDTSPVHEGLRKAKDNLETGLQKRYWERLERLGNPAEDSKLAGLYVERDEINGLIELAKIKYHTRVIDEKSFSNITEEYQKRLIELESKIKKVESEEEAAGRAAYKVEPVASGIPEELQASLVPKVMGMADNHILLLLSKNESHAAVIPTVLDVLIRKRGMAGVYISVSRPHESILSMMHAAGIPASDIQFIDCISSMTGKVPQAAGGNVVFVENPSSLEEVSMYLDKSLKSITNPKKFIILDSLSSMLIYNSDKSVKEFTHFIINRMRLENIAGIILCTEKKEAEDLIRTLAPMCDAEMRF